MQVIYTYTRAQAIADGALIDVSKMAVEAGIVLPVAITAALHADINNIPARFIGVQSYDGRLWDALWMLRCAIMTKNKAGRDGSVIEYDLFLCIDGNRHYKVKSVCGAGDDMEPVITLMKPEED